MNDESARIIWPPGNPDNTGLSCSEVAERAVEGYFSNCTILHSVSDGVCQCGEELPPFSCPLCGNDSEGDGTIVLPEPNRVVAGKTCQQWQDFATNDASTVDCTHYQTIVGAYCGCDISQPNYFDGYCRLCKDKLLPDFDEKVTYQSGKQKYCVEVEVKLNTHPDDHDCEQFQDSHEKACGCDTSGDLPTLGPTKSNEGESSASNHRRGTATVMFGLCFHLIIVTMGIMTFFV